MIPEIDKKKLYQKDALSRRYYISRYLDKLIRMPRANFDNEANKLSVEYLYKFNDLLAEYKKIGMFYDVMVTYAYANSDENIRCYIGAIITVNNSQRKQRRHVKCVKDAVKRTRLNKDLAFMLDDYIIQINERIKYLKETIIPLQINLTPLAAIYNLCLETGEDFSDKFVDFILPEELNYYMYSDYKKDLNFDEIDRVKKENADRLSQMIDNFNKEYKDKHPRKYKEFMSEYFSNIERKTTAKEKKKEERRQEKELKQIAKIVADAEFERIAEAGIDNEYKSLKNIFDISCKNIKNGINIPDIPVSFMDRFVFGMDDGLRYLVLYKSGGSQRPAYVRRCKNKYSKTINPSDATLFSEEEKNICCDILDNTNGKHVIKVIDLNDFSLQMKFYRENRDWIVKYVPYDKIDKWKKEPSHLITKDTYHRFKVSIEKDRKYLGIYYSKTSSVPGIRFVTGTYVSIQEKKKFDGCLSVNNALLFTEKEVDEIKDFYKEDYHCIGLEFINTDLLHFEVLDT